MPSLGSRESARIAAVLQEWDTEADTTRMGSWGILYLLCGASAGHSHDVPADHSTFSGWLSAKGGDPSVGALAFDFRDLILSWINDPAGLAIARTRLAEYQQRNPSFPAIAEAPFVTFFRLAIMLNSLTDYESPETVVIRRWATENNDGWAKLFYAAGTLVGSDKNFPLHEMKRGLLIASHSAKDKVKALIDDFEAKFGERRQKTSETTSKDKLFCVVATLVSDMTLRWSCRSGDLIFWFRWEDLFSSIPSVQSLDFWSLKDGDFVTITNRLEDVPGWIELKPNEVAARLVPRLKHGATPDDSVTDGLNIWRVRAGDRIAWVGQDRPGQTAIDDVLSVVLFDESALMVLEGAWGSDPMMFGVPESASPSHSDRRRAHTARNLVHELGMPRTLAVEWIFP